MYPTTSYPVAPELVREINRVFHDIEGTFYNTHHPEIFTQERDRWLHAGRLFVQAHKNPIRILDVGSGTGFVPLQLGCYLRTNDVFICSDISGEMLKSCERNVADKGFRCSFQFQDLNEFYPNLPPGPFDFITLNSVLHHLPGIKAFFKSADLALKDGGFLILGHEPNRGFYSEKVCWIASNFCKGCTSPRHALSLVLRYTGIRKLLTVVGLRSLLSKYFHRGSVRTAMLDSVNERLMEEKIIASHLSHEEIVQAVDIHSPTAGENIDPARGFDVQEIQRLYLPDYEIRYFETYNHLGETAHNNRFTKRLERYLRLTYPESGATLFVVLQKKLSGQKECESCFLPI